MRTGGEVWRLALLLLVAVAGVPWACDDDDDVAGDDDAGDDTAGDDDDTAPSLHGTASIRANPHNRFSAVVEARVDGAADVVVEFGEEDRFDHATPHQLADADQATTFLLLGLRSSTTYRARVVAASGSRTWTSDPLEITTDPLPGGWPDCAVTFSVDEDAFDADEVVCTDGEEDDGTPVYYCVDRWGVPRWELRHPDGVSIRHVEALSDGRLVATGYSDSILAFFTPDGALQREYTALNFEGQTRFDHEWINQHDAIEITEGQWAGAVALMTNAVDVYDGTYLNGLGILVIDPDDGDVLWDWSVHGERGDGVPIDPALDPTRSGLYTETGVTWLHANGILHGVDGDGDEYFWVSLRAQDWIIRVDVADDSIRWRLGYQGDFALVDDLDAAVPVPLDDNEWMYQQHAPAWIERDGARTRFVVFDNGNVRPDPLPDGGVTYSRVVEYVVDEDTMRATVSFAYGSASPDAAEHFASKAYGDADLLPEGDALLFDVGLQDPQGGFLGEISFPGGVERWRFTCPEVELYQLEYYPDLYEMSWQVP